MNRTSSHTFAFPTRAEHPARRAALEALRSLVLEMAGRKLPGERELALRLNISRQHLRTLLDQLESEGMVERRQGSGTYARDVHDTELSRVGLLIDARLKLGNDPFFSLLTERLQLCLQAAGIHCVVERIDGQQRPRFLGDGMITLGVAGLAALAHLKKFDPPAVSLMATEMEERQRFTAHVSLMLADDEGAGMMAAQRAIEEGARRLFFFGRTDLPASNARWLGVQRVVERYPDVTLQLHTCSMNYPAGRNAAVALGAEIGATDVSGTALIAANDWLAVGLRSGFGECGSPLRRAPLYSFDGLPIASDPLLEIRSLHFPFSSLVEDALAELRRLVRHRDGRVIRYTMEWADETGK